MGSTNSINPCIKATLGPTSLILEGSGKGCFFGRFRMGQKGAPKSTDETAGRLLGGKMAHGGPAKVPRRGPIWLGGPKGWPRARARGIESIQLI